MKSRHTPMPGDSFLELLPHPVVEVDASYAVTSLNPAARLAVPDLERSGPEHPLLAGLAHMVESLRRETSSMMVFVREVAQAGVTYEQQIFTVPRKARLYLFMTDVTERAQAMQQLKEHEQQLRDANLRLGELLTIKEQFITHVSHELRTPLAITSEALNLVLDQIVGPISAQQTKVLTMAQSNIDRLSRLINDLLDISKLGAGQATLRRTRVDCAALVAAVLAAFESRARAKGVALVADLPRAETAVYADADKLTQVLTNLVDNALKFTEQGSITVAVKPEQEQTVCTVADTGCGIAPEDLPRVFGKFQQFHWVDGPGAKGTGLGLAIARELMALHDGSIRVTSVLRQGTTFTLTVPTYAQVDGTNAGVR